MNCPHAILGSKEHAATEGKCAQCLLKELESVRAELAAALARADATEYEMRFRAMYESIRASLPAEDRASLAKEGA